MLRVWAAVLGCTALFGAQRSVAFQLQRGWVSARGCVALSAAKPRRVLLFGDADICRRQAELVGFELGLPVPAKGERRGDGSWVAPAGSFPRSGASVLASSFPSGVEVAVVLAHDPDHQGLTEEAQDEVIDALAERLGAEVVSVDASGPTEETFQSLLSALEFLFDDESENGDDVADEKDYLALSSTPKLSARKSAGKSLTDLELFGPLLGSLEGVGASAGGPTATTLLASLNSRERTLFGPLNLSPVLHESLSARGFATPTPIQIAAAQALYAGDSAILHAETGSGKTLSFLLPLLQRLIDADGGLGAANACALAVVSPTRELSAQTFRELRALLPGADAFSERSKGSQRPLVQLVDDDESGDAPLWAAVVVGTAKQLAERLAPSPARQPRGYSSSPSSGYSGSRGSGEAASGGAGSVVVGCLVLDEVDRLFALLGKYSTRQEQERASRHSKPALVLLEAALRGNSKLQVVACSATVGRHLRREVGRLLSPDAVKDGVQVIRPPAAVAAATFLPTSRVLSSGEAEAMTVAELKAALVARGVKVKAKALKADLLGQLAYALREEQQQEAASLPAAAAAAAAAGSGRAVTIPSGIVHAYLPLREPVSLAAKVNALLVALTLDQPRAPLVFLPDGTSVATVVASLQRAGFPQSLGLDAATTGRANVADLYTQALRARRRLSGGGERNAATSGAAAAGVAAVQPVLPILVACESAARGLHLDGIDAVYVLARPKTADEYLHLAGRTGRCGEAGRVVSVVSYTEADALQAWSTQLGFKLTRVAEVDLD